MRFVFLILLVLLLIFPLREGLESINRIVTQSPFDQQRLILCYDNFDLNDEIMAQDLKEMFPLTLQSPVGRGNLLMVPQFQNLDTKDMLFLVSMFNISLTLLLPVDREDAIEDMVIGTIRSHYSYPFLLKLLQIFRLPTVIRSFATYEDLDQAWNTQSITAVFLICSHPNPFVEKFSFKNRIRFYDWSLLFDSQINAKATLLFYFPDMIQTSIPVSTYRIFTLSLAFDGYGFKINLLGHRDVPSEYAYTLVQTLDDNYLTLQIRHPFLQNVNRQVMSYCPPYLQYHPGAKMFYINQNYITEQPSTLCSLLDTGIKCDESKLRLVRSYLDRHGIL